MVKRRSTYDENILELLIMTPSYQVDLGARVMNILDSFSKADTTRKAAIEIASDNACDEIGRGRIYALNQGDVPILLTDISTQIDRIRLWMLNPVGAEMKKDV